MPRKAKKIEIPDEIHESTEAPSTPPSTPMAVATKKKRAPRKPTAYNLFMREKMQSEAVKKLNPKERFGAVAKMWKESKTA